MTWRPARYLLEGELDNTTAGRVTGWLRFAGLQDQVTLDLEGDFCSDIRGGKIALRGRYVGSLREAAEYMDGFGPHHTGQAIRITAGRPPIEWADFPFLQWSWQGHDHVILYLEPGQLRVLIAPPAKCAGLVAEESPEDIPGTE